MHCQAPSVAVRVANNRSGLSEKGNKTHKSLEMDWKCIGKASECIGKASQNKTSRKEETNRSTEMENEERDGNGCSMHYNAFSPMHFQALRPTHSQAS